MFSGLFRRIRQSRPPLIHWFGGSLAWGAAMALAVLISLAMQSRLGQAGLLLLVGIFFCGGFLAWFFAVPIARFLCLGRRMEARLAISLLLLTIGSAMATAFLFAMQYRLFYAQWHEPFGTPVWMFQFVFTSASAVYQFGVIGLRMLMPSGFLFLLTASTVLSRLIR